MYNAAVGVGTRRVGTAVNEKDSSTPRRVVVELLESTALKGLAAV